MTTTELIKITPENLPIILIGILIALFQLFIRALNRRENNKAREEKIRLDYAETFRKNLIDNDEFKEQLIQKDREESSQWRSYVLEELKLKDKRLDEHTKQLNQTTQELSLVRQELAIAQEDADKVPILTELVKNLQGQVEEITKQLNILIEENLSLRVEGETKKVLITEREREIARLQFEIRTLKDELEEKRKEIEIKDQQISEYVIKLQEYISKLEKLEMMLENRKEIKDERSATDSGENNSVVAE